MRGISHKYQHESGESEPKQNSARVENQNNGLKDAKTETSLKNCRFVTTKILIIAASKTQQ